MVVKGYRHRHVIIGDEAARAVALHVNEDCFFSDFKCHYVDLPDIGGKVQVEAINVGAAIAECFLKTPRRRRDE